MINKNITCPVCDSLCKLVMEEKSTLVILNCPECGAGLIDYKNQTYHIENDRDKIAEIIEDKSLKSILEFIERVSVSKDKNKKAKEILPYIPTELKKEIILNVKSDWPEDQPASALKLEPISKDDITNLIIDINTSKSVSEFLKKLE